MIDMAALEQALSHIEELGQAELEFMAGDTRVFMRMLTPDEEMEVQRYARVVTAAVDDRAPADEKELAMMEFMDRFKLTVLAYSMVQIGNLDLRDVATIATGETLANGTAVHIPKHEAVRQLIHRWKRPIVLGCFQKYGELTERVEKSSESNIKWEPTDLAAEIDRLTKRRDELIKLQQEQMPPSEGNQINKQVQAMVELGEHQQRTGHSIADAPPRRMVTRSAPVLDNTPDSPVPDDGPDDEPPVVVTSAPSRTDRQAPVSGRAPATPAAAAPQQPTGRRTAVPTAASAPPPPRVEEAPPVVEEPPPGHFDTLMDSMSDPFDENALAVENARLMALRRKQAAAEEAAAERAAAIRAEALGESHGARNAAESAPVQAPRRRAPPHRAAANTADAVLDSGAGSMKAARPHTPVANIGGKEVYALEPQTVTARTAEASRAARGAKVPVNSTPQQGGSENPRFRKG